MTREQAAAFGGTFARCMGSDQAKMLNAMASQLFHVCQNPEGIAAQMEDIGKHLGSSGATLLKKIMDEYIKLHPEWDQ